LKRAENGLAPVLPRNDDGSSAPPFSYVARNSTLVLLFNDVLDDSAAARIQLNEMVRIITGYPPATPFQGRVLFDPNHGAILGGSFHSTRVLIDFSISNAEAANLPTLVAANSFGLPSSLPNSPLPNVSVRIPTQTDFGQGQFRVLATFGGSPIGQDNNGPMDVLSPTRDLVRAFRAGNNTDINNGFVLDLSSPQLVGSWPLQLTDMEELDGGEPGFEFIGNLTYLNPCQKAPQRGEILTVGSHFLQVSQNATSPNNSVVPNVVLELLAAEGLQSANLLNGRGFIRPLYNVNFDVREGCWISFSPEPAIAPDQGVDTRVQAILRFSEAMDPASGTPMENFQLVRGFAGLLPDTTNIVIGSVVASDDLQEFRFASSLPFAHIQQSDPYHFLLGGFTDLAGNPLLGAPNFIPFTVDPNEPAEENRGIALLFQTPNEVDPAITGPDLRGQFFYDLNRGVIMPRPVAFSSANADRSNPVPSIMVPFAPGVQTPLSPLGSRLQTVWRYVDFGWQVLDETRYNIDVVGLSWAPISGLVVADFYPEFELLLAHSKRQPDECVTNFLLPAARLSGLVTNLFANNPLIDEHTGQEVVHDRSLGYVINPSNLTVAPTGTVLMPYPLNRGTGPITSFTWRDTRSLSREGPQGRGLPLCIEIGAPLFLEDGPPRRMRREGNVPTFGLPLLIEVKTFPSTQGIGLNALDISLAINSSAQPNFRTYSTGGINRFGQPVEVQPDLALNPAGGFNPNSNPPGRRTPDGDNSFYIGAIDYVTRISQVHSVWLAGRPEGAAGVGIVPNYQRPVVLPRPEVQPFGTQAILEYRGATSFLDTEDSVFDALQLDAYGDQFELQPPEICNQCIRPKGQVIFWNNIRTWTDNIDDIDGANYLQLRITFVNNVESGESPEIDAIGIPIDQ